MNTARLADRMAHVALSPTMRAAMEAERLKRAGVDVVDLGAGEPDFPTPPHVVAAAHEALDRGLTKYTPNPGTIDLREAIAARYAADHGITLAAENVIVTAGGKQALFHAALALFGPGDEVITHAPGWPTIAEQIKLAGATPIVVPTVPEDNFALTAQGLLSGVTSRTRGLVINSPANPTGAVMTDAEAETLAREAHRLGLWVVLDLCYDRLVYEGRVHGLPRVLADRIPEQLVLCGSASKVYAMTGWRCGWLAGPTAVVRAANALQSHETSNVNSIAQRAAIAALTGPQECVGAMLAEYQRRRDQMIAWLAREPRLRVGRPQGAFYLLPDVRAFLSQDRCPTTLVFAERLLAESHVVVTAGEAFYAPGFVRLSYATSLDRLREGATRLIDFVRSLG